MEHVAEHGDQGEVEWLDAEDLPTPRPPAGTTPRRWLRWTPLLVLLVAALVIALVANRHRSTPSAAPTSHAASTPSSSAEPTPPASVAPRDPIAVTNAGHPLLGVHAGWELFGRGPDSVVRIQLALGRVTSTTVPGLASSGPVSFVVGADRAIILPLDFVPGYLVPDGQPPGDLPAAIGRGGTLLPGPDPGHMWMMSGDDRSVLKLTALDGTPTGAIIRIPAGFGDPFSDGAGYAVVLGVGGAYDARPDGLHKISTGQLLAAGPTRWLTVECDKRARCSMIVIDRADGTRRTLGSSKGYVDTFATGTVSPDGAYAAVMRSADQTTHLIDLRSGADHALAVDVSQERYPLQLVWSPDSRWLFVSDVNEQVRAVEARDRSVHDLGVRLPAVDQLALRAADA